MKKLFPEAPDVAHGVANRAIKIIERHLRVHRADRARDLPEEAKVRLYRDLRFLFESDQQHPGGKPEGATGGIRQFFSRFWEKIENFLSIAGGSGERYTMTVFSWACFGDTPRLTALPLSGGSSTCDQSV